MSHNSFTFIGDRTKKIWKWEKFQTMAKWFESNIELKKGKVRGKFKTSTAPHTREIFKALDTKHVNIVTLKVSSQTQKTTTGLGAIMKWIDTDYHDLFFMIPRANEIKKFLNFKVQPMIDGCPVVKEKMRDYRQDEAERKNSFFYKTAQNLFAVVSTNDTKSITVKYGVFDEVAEFQDGIVEEALERMKEYGKDFKALITSTQEDENDAINHFYNISEAKYRYHMFCPHCEDYFYPMPEHLKFISLENYKIELGYLENEDIDYNTIMSDYKPYASRNSYLECPCCHSKITDKERVEVIKSDKGRWFQVVATQKTDDDEVTWGIAKTPKTYYESVGFDLNSAMALRVPLQKIAEKEIECAYAKPHLKDALYRKFYVGWWNLLYTSKALKKTTKNDILLLTNKLPLSECHNDTNAIHIGVDLQKDRLYYEILGVRYAEDIVADIPEYGELYSDGVGNDFKELEKIIESDFYTSDGRKLKVRSVGIDIRGFSLEEKDSRSNEALDFIFDYAKKLKDHGVIDWDKFIYPMMGQDKLEERHEVRGYKTRVRERDVVSYTGEVETLKLNEIVFSNMAIKTILFKMIERGIEKAKASDGDTAYEYDRKLLYVTDYMTEQHEERQKLSPQERRTKHSIESHLSSEHLTYKILKSGKPASEETYEKKYQGVRNDWLDCTVMGIVQSIMLGTYRSEKPKEKPKINFKDRLKGAI